MNKDLKKILIQQGIDTVGRLAGNYLLDSLTREGQDPDKPVVSETADGGVNIAAYPDLRMKPGQTDKEFRRGAENLTPRIKREDLPGGFGAQTVLGPVVENPSEAAIYARSIAPYAGMAAAGTALNFIFGGKPSSEYKAPVGSRKADGNINQNVLASNTKTANELALAELKYQHAVNLMKHKADIDVYKNEANAFTKQQANVDNPLKDYLSILEYESLDRQGMLGVEKDIARSIFGTGVRL